MLDVDLYTLISTRLLYAGAIGGGFLTIRCGILAWRDVAITRAMAGRATVVIGTAAEKLLPKSQIASGDDFGGKPEIDSTSLFGKVLVKSLESLELSHKP